MRVQKLLSRCGIVGLQQVGPRAAHCRAAAAGSTGQGQRAVSTEQWAAGRGCEHRESDESTSISHPAEKGRHSLEKSRLFWLYLNSKSQKKAGSWKSVVTKGVCLSARGFCLPCLPCVGRRLMKKKAPHTRFNNFNQLESNASMNYRKMVLK